MGHVISYSDDFWKHIYKLPKSIQHIARKKLNQLKIIPIGEALSDNLKGYYSIHFHRNKYRIVYFKEKDKLQIMLVDIGKRGDHFYKDLARKVNSS